MYLVNSFLEKHNYYISTQEVTEGLFDSYVEYYSLLNKIEEYLKLGPREKICYNMFIRTVFYDYRSHIVFTNFREINSIILEKESFASVFKIFLKLYCFSYCHDSFIHIGSMFIVKFGWIYSHLVSYYKYGFSFNSLTVLKPFKSRRRFEKSIIDYHSEGKCIKLELYQLRVKTASCELFVADYYDNNRNWQFVFEEYETSTVQCGIRLYYLESSLGVIWPNFTEGFMNSDLFVGISDAILDEITKSEYQPQFCFVVVSYGICTNFNTCQFCCLLDDELEKEVEDYWNYNDDDLIYLREIDED